MVRCQVCQQDFKSKQGLSGHQQLKHAGEHSAERQCEGSCSAHSTAGEGSPRAEASGGAALSQGSVAQLERIEAALGELLVSGEEFHQLEQQIKDSFTRGMREAVSTMVAIPGVSTAKIFNDWSKDHEVAYPQFPVVHSWEDVPGVKELIEKYQMDNTVFTLVDAVPSSNYENILAGLFAK